MSLTISLASYARLAPLLGRCQASRKRPRTFRRIKKKPKADDTLDNAIEVLKQVSSRTHSVPNEFTSFGQHIAVQMNCLPLEEAILLQQEIQQLITAAPLRNLKKT